jgi:hypothetical protein
MDDPLPKRLGAEFLGTFLLVFGGCGAAVISAKFAQTGIGILGVALAFGLAVLTMAYAVGNVSGGHFNPAVTIGLTIARRFPGRDVAAYLINSSPRSSPRSRCGSSPTVRRDSLRRNPDSRQMATAIIHLATTASGRS